MASDVERARPLRCSVLLTVLQLSEVWNDGAALLRAAGEQGLEGIVSKYRNAPYRSGHSDAWIKVKVPGWTEANQRRFM
jgi:ATP-dependent DNA ligase